MVEIILHDFILPPLNNISNHKVDHHTLLLKNKFKIESDKIINYWKRIDEYIHELQQRRIKLKAIQVIPDDLIGNEYVIRRIAKYIRAKKMFFQIPKHLRDCHRVAMSLVSQFGFYYSYCSEELRKDRKICLAALKSYPIFHQLPEEFQKERKFVFIAVKNQFNISVPKEFLSDREIVKLMVKMGRSLESIMSDIPQEFLDDKEIGLEAVKRRPQSVKLLSERLQYDPSFFFKCVKSNSFSFPEYPKSMQDNREYAKILAQNKVPLFIFSKEIRKDREIALICVKKRCSDLRYAHSSIITKEFVLSIISHHTYACYDFLNLIPYHLILDTEISQYVVKHCQYCYSSLKKEFKTKEVMECYLALDTNIR